MLISSAIQAVVHHVAATGGDFATITEVNAHTFVADDQILFNRGETFVGTLVVSQSGTNGHPIIYGAYGTGDDPIITGFTNVSAWINLGSNIWESTSAVSTLDACNMIVINGVNTPMGRYPNTGYLTYQTYSTNTSIISSTVNSSTTNWTGAEVVIKKAHWIIDRYPITGHSGGTITYSNGGSYYGQNNYGFFIQNDIRTLDVQNEWYYNTSTKKISIYSTSQPTNVKVSTVDKLVYISGFQYITFNGLSFQGSNTDAISIAASGNQHIEILNCSIDYSGRNAVAAIGSKYIKLENTFINHSNNDAILLSYNCSHASILNNSINNTALIPGMGVNGDGTYRSICSNASNCLLQYNTINSTGFTGIFFMGDSVSVKNNFVNNSCLLKDDGAGISTYNGTEGTPYTGLQIVNNIVLNSIGTSDGTSGNGTQAYGIYLDGYSANVDVVGNTVANCSNNGIFVNGSKNINIEDNTLYNNGTQLYFHNWGPVSTGINAKNNIYFSKYSSQFVWAFESVANNIANFGVSDSNYYARPIDDNQAFFYMVHTPTYSYTTYSLSQWQTLISQDANSHKAPFAISDVNDLRFEYNATTSPVTVTLDQNYRDVTNTTDYTSITLQPYTSAVLMKHSAFTSTVRNSGAYHKKALVDHKKVLKF